MSIFDKSVAYKPFRYPWAFEAYQLQKAMSWNVQDVSLDKDVRDWNDKLTDQDRHLITQIFRYFVQGDVDVAHAYLHVYIPMFKPVELQMMLAQFASTEALHLHAYSLLLDTVGMPEVEYQAFQKFEAMQKKHEYFYENRSGLSELEKIVLELAIFSAFGEGMQLFSSFAILLNFPRRGLLEKMGRIIKWSIRDEALHVESMVKVFHALVDENPHVWTDKVKAYIYSACRDMVDLEDCFIDLAFELGDSEGLTKEEIKQYVRFISDRRLNQLGLKANFKVDVNPIPWIEDAINIEEFANFFETEVIEYSAGLLQGEWENIYSQRLMDESSIKSFVKNRTTGNE